MISVVANKKAKDEYYVPVSWTMCGKVRVQATSVEEAYKYVEDHKADISINDAESWYLDDSYQIDNGREGCSEETAANLQSAWAFYCEKFECQKDLARYTDSMLFDHFMSDKSLEDDESYIAGATFSNGLQKDDLHVRLVVTGEVKVVYKGVIYKRPSDFPDELIKLIMEKPNQWQNEEGVYVDERNWFEIMLVEDNEAWVFESDISTMTPESMLEALKAAAEVHFADAADVVKTNLGYIPKKDFYDIRAQQAGFEDYEDMQRAMKSISGEEDH